MSRFATWRVLWGIVVTVLATSPAFAQLRPSEGAVRPAASAVERAELERLQKDRKLNEKQAERLARLIVSEASRSDADYQARWADVEQALIGARQDLSLMKAGGPYPANWLKGRWLVDWQAAKDPLARELFQRVFLDQWQLSVSPQLDESQKKAFNAAFQPEIQANIRNNAQWLKGALDKVGWFDISRYGEEASQAAWLLIQHSDHDLAWQNSMLAVLAPRVRSGDMQAKYYAYLVDRVAVNEKRPQVYGTQGSCTGPGNWQPFELVEPKGLDTRRQSVGLEPIAQYRARFTCP